ncbi:MAG TPA: FecR family protein [Terriglobales bacterium]|nr:FecR family protein [Terriglobales bacterium]
MKSARWLLLILLVLLVVVPPSEAAGAGPATETVSLLHVRIVRLSFVQGEVAVRQSGAADWSAGAVNTPLQEGFEVATSANSFAEIEFENGSTARLGQDSQIDLNELALTPQGDRINHLTLSKGYATFHFTPEHHDQYVVDASGLTMTVHGQAEFRANLGNDSLRMEVFKGTVATLRDGRTEDVGQNRVLNYTPSAVEALSITNGFQKDGWDKWTQARDTQAVLARDDSPLSLSRSMYGWSDLDTYGAWGYFPGYGNGWAPYEPAGWSPYSAGAWDYYPSWGFTWVSAEPWGWLPYHNGLWNYDASMGWFWMPGSLDTWSPAAVNWYQGPGWVGWTPAGSGAGACRIAAAGCLTAVAPGRLARGVPFHPGSGTIMHLTGAIKGARIDAPHLGGGVSARPVTVLGPPLNLRVRTASVGSPSPHVAPSSVVMGRDVNPATFLHHGFLSGPRVIRAPLGRTLGGTLPTVISRNGDISINSKYRGARQSPASGIGKEAPARRPVMMAHGGGAASARRARMSGNSVDTFGGISAQPSSSTSRDPMPSAPMGGQNSVSGMGARTGGAGPVSSGAGARR